MAYQVIFEGLWGSSRGAGSIAIDDISFYEGSCSSNIFSLFIAIKDLVDPTLLY